LFSLKQVEIENKERKGKSQVKEWERGMLREEVFQAFLIFGDCYSRQRWWL
jgi:hypothetical protein